ncbi:hypothetical protein COU53_01410 [Candidatus Pacearchaeota archaeon CG10_big_fil_rev_8_21_14_0_10_30_48]|nr:MAG: hypothetical protein COU53_01410 [Candidatus Pacearchaeota archaeon CG10_big_fil_rev_8_21_14_0_10_30_48]
MKLINEKDIGKIGQIISSIINSGEKIVVLAGNEEFNRKVLEKKDIDVLLFSNLYGKDKLKQRDSGLNQVLCKLANKNDIAIGVDLKQLDSGSDFDKSVYLARLMQNIRLCKKFKVKMIIINVKENNKKDLNSFLLTLGMDTKMAKSAVENSFS